MKKFFIIINIFAILLVNMFLICSCDVFNYEKLQMPETIITDVENEIDYDVYKKIDFSNFIWQGGDSPYVQYGEDGLWLAPAPCKVTIKSSVKIEKGPGLSSSELNDGFAIDIDFGAVEGSLYYADFNNNFFDQYHEIERACEYYNGGLSGHGYVTFSNLGVIRLDGISGLSEKYLTHNETEYVGAILDQDEKQIIVKVTIKDVYYKISKPTGVVSDWNLNSDFEYYENQGNKVFIMKNLDAGYSYIIKPRFTFNINEKYNQNFANYLDFFYIADNGILLQSASIMNGREHNINSIYSKLGIGITKNKFKYANSWDSLDNMNIIWDKDNTTILVTDNSGNNVATIKIDFIKEYKYKFCKENDTPGYRRYIAASKK